MKTGKVLLVCLAIFVLIAVGVLIAPVVRPLIMPEANPCEARPCAELAERCKRAEASGDFKVAMACGFFLMSDERTESNCREVCERLDKYGRGR